MRALVLAALLGVISAKHKHHEHTLLMVEREPLLTWKEKVPKGHPVDYPVPNFG